MQQKQQGPLEPHRWKKEEKQSLLTSRKVIFNIKQVQEKICSS